MTDTPIESKRKAVYEYIFLAIGHNFLEEREESVIAKDLELVRFYIDNWEARNNINDLHDDIVLLQILKAQRKLYNIPLTNEFLLTWESNIEKYLDKEISAESNIDRQCTLLELRGHLERQKDTANPVESTKKAFEFYRKIPPLLPTTQMYSLTRLYGQIDSIVRMLIQYDANPELQNVLDEFMTEIESYAKETAQRHNNAHDLVERGALYLQNQNLASALKALELFQKAKSLWRSEYFKEGYVLALLNVSQVYSSLGMGYASKYYALLALWSTWNFSDQGLYKRIPQALGLICFCDFTNGAWLNALSDFNLYLFTKREFSEKGLELDGDEVYERTVFEVAAIAHAAPLIQPQMSETITDLKAKWGYVWDEQIEPLIQSLAKEIKDIAQLKEILASQIRDMPLNDIAQRRAIKFSALDVLWTVEFDNTESMTAIAEEFVSVLQIVLCEIARSNTSVIVGGQAVNISLDEGHFQKENLGEGNWTLTIPKFDSSEAEEIKMHYIYLDKLVRSILETLTGLSKPDFMKYYFEHLLLKENLSEKALEGTAYQRAYRKSIDGSHFSTLAVKEFEPVPPGTITVVYRKYLTTKKV